MSFSSSLSFLGATCANSALWQMQRWENFSHTEMSCPHCGEYYHDPDFMDCLQKARQICARPFRINSAHRCSLYNAHIGGAPFSTHLRLAVDIDLHGHDRDNLYAVCCAVGFRGFGFYHTFLHIDKGRERHWYSNEKARKLWKI